MAWGKLTFSGYKSRLIDISSKLEELIELETNAAKDTLDNINNTFENVKKARDFESIDRSKLKAKIIVGTDNDGN